MRQVDAIEDVRDLCAGSDFVIFDFTATWCGPCKAIAPVFEELAAAHPEIAFVKVDVDVCSEAATECQVMRMPTFQVWCKNERLYVLEGSSEAELRRLVDMVKQRHDGLRIDADF